MQSFRPNRVSVSAIFEYPNPIDATLFREHLEEEEWFSSRRSRRPPDNNQDTQVLIGDMELNDDSFYRMGITEGSSIIYANNVSLSDFGNCAFLTIRSRTHSNIEAVVRDATRVFDLVNTANMSDQLSTYEIHVDSNVRVNDQQDIDIFLNEDALARLKEIHGKSAGGQKLTLKSHAEYTSSEWYRLSIDLTANMNPLLWGIDYQRRFNTTDEIQSQSIESDIKSILNESLPSTESQDENE